MHYAGPSYYISKGKKELKAYILLFFCSVSRAVQSCEGGGGGEGGRAGKGGERGEQCRNIKVTCNLMN